MESLWEIMESTGVEEKRIAIEKSKADDSFIPYTTVLLDEGSQRVVMGIITRHLLVW